MKNKKLILVVTLILIFLASIGFSYAYFTATIVNKDVKDQIVQTGTLQLTYIDGDEIVGTNIQPGWTATKTIKVVNTSSLNTTYNLKWKELTNEITNDELVYIVYCESNNSFCKYVNQYETAVPSSVDYIAKNIMIYPGEEQTFTINFTFKELNFAQDYNQGKKFKGVLNIEEASSSNTTYDTHIQLLNSSSNPLSNYIVSLSSGSITGKTDENGYFVLKNVHLGENEFIIKDTNNNIVDTKKIILTEDKLSKINDNNIVASTMADNISLTIHLNDSNKIEKISNQMLTPSECFAFDNGTITDYYIDNENCSNDIVIPEKINDISVTSLGTKSFANKKINTVIFPSSLESIKNYSFYGNNLRKIDFTSNIKTIGAASFMSNQLDEVIIPDGVTTISANVFYDNFIENLKISSTVTSIGYQAFNQNLLPDDQAFIYKRNSDGSEDETKIVSYGGKNLNVVIPNGVASLEIYSLSCSSSITFTLTNYPPLAKARIENISLPESLTEIKLASLSNCALTELNLPTNVKTIGSLAFKNNKINKINFSDNITSIDSLAFNDNELESITIPNSVTSIANFAFANNKLSNISLPSTLTSIGAGAFNNNKMNDDGAFIYARNSDGSEDKTKIVSYAGLNKNVVIPNNISTIGKSAFESCDIEEVKLSNSVTALEANSFSRNNLISIVLPESITSIGRMTFYDNKINSVNIPSKLTKIDELVFAKNRLTNINIPKTITSIGASAFNDNLLSDSQAIIYARNEDGSDDKTTIVSYGGANKNIVVPDGVTTLNRYAFYECMLKSITLPESLVTIGSTSLCGNLLETISIPSSVNEISDNAFCSNNFKNAIIKGKTSSSEFKTYSPSWSWNSKVTCIKNNTSNVENGCITWEGK